MSKHKVAIITDSTAVLPHELLDAHPIFVIPQNLHWGEESLLDNVDITPAQFYRRLQTAKELPTTSQPSAGTFLTFFQEVAEKAESIVAILISAELSGTVASAHAARDMMEGPVPIEIVDTRSASLGLALVVSAAAHALEVGKNHEEIAELARMLSPHLHTLFVVDTLEYLHKGGRIGGAKRLLGSVLALKPLLHLKEGRVEPLTSVRTKRKAVDRMLEVVRENAAGASALHMAVAHAAAEEEADQLAQRVQEEFQPVELMRSDVSPVIGTHTGPGTLAVAFYDGGVLPATG
ncbi:MAG: DegV family protein [Anaerolineae bacterium]|nr:DegV family protein [Anaerolineae bacterium]